MDVHIDEFRTKLGLRLHLDASRCVNPPSTRIKENEYIYIQIYSFLPFDDFCKLREYSHKVIKDLHVPLWKHYFKQNNIKIVKLQKMTNLLKGTRIFFNHINDNFVNNRIYMKYGMDKFDTLINKKNMFMSVQVEIELCINYLKERKLIRNPYYLTMNDIIHSGYINLLGYIIHNYFSEVDVSYLLYPVILPDEELISHKNRICAIRMAIHTDKGYIIKEIKKLKNGRICYVKNKIDSMENSILKRDFNAVVFLIRIIEMIPTAGNMKLIKKYIPQLSKPLDLMY